MVRLTFWVFGVALALASWSASAQAVDRAAVVSKICQDSAAMTEATAELLAIAVGDDPVEMAWARALAAALSSGHLRCDTQNGGAFIVSEGGATDAVTGAAASVPEHERKPVVNLKNRRVLEVAGAALALRAAPAAADRDHALTLLQRRVNDLPEALLDKAADSETDPALQAKIQSVALSAQLQSPDAQRRIAAIRNLADKRPNSRTLGQITKLTQDPAYQADPQFALTVDQAVKKVGRVVAIGDVLATLYSGISYASILFMASIGLAIIFGLMGVINLAQGEFIMIGAYATWLTQEFLSRFAPAFIDWYLILAIPVAFLATAGVGLILEATLLRFLYRRPLMSLIATWAVSLLLINLVRVIFGTQNIQFYSPFFMTGGVPLIGDFVFTWNRMFAIAFAVATLAITWYIVRYTPLGLNIRAVTQNRDMAGCVGVPTRRVDRIAFGFGSGLAGLAGLALAPIFSVNPLMGQNFIIDSFMVVVLGGVGTIAGTVVASLGVGQANVLIEPFYGAVAAKVIVLALIIVFLQWRPEGLFVLRGRRK